MQAIDGQSNNTPSNIVYPPEFNQEQSVVDSAADFQIAKNEVQDLNAANDNLDPHRKENDLLHRISETKVYQKIQEHLPLKGAFLTAAGHTVSALANVFNIKPEITDKLSLNFSKVVLSGNCFVQTIEALKKNRLMEAIARFIEPIFIIAEKKVEDLGLARALGLGISQLVESQAGILDVVLQNKGLNKDTVSKGQDLDGNLQAMKKMFTEVFSRVDGKRRFLTGFTAKETKNALLNFVKTFNVASFAELIKTGDAREKIQAFFDKSGISHLKEICKGSEDLDKGHTTALSGYMMILGSVIGYLDKSTRGLFYKLGGTLRTLGGMVADAGILGNPDPKFNIAAPFLIVNGILDIGQRLIPENMKRMIKAVGNMSMAFYNVGVSIYLNRSSDKTNEEDKVQFYDTDLKLNTKEEQVSNEVGEPALMAA